MLIALNRMPSHPWMRVPHLQMEKHSQNKRLYFTPMIWNSFIVQMTNSSDVRRIPVPFSPMNSIFLSAGRMKNAISMIFNHKMRNRTSFSPSRTSFYKDRF